jgi:UDP:flavonoid glycosyltransferase YjiC (YdhE family)
MRYFETIQTNAFYSAGVPQVLLPPWSDCYDFGNRVEMLGIGRWANKQAKPRWEQLELANSINEVLFGPEAGQIKKRAVELAERHPEFSGRERAAEEIIALAS